MKKKKPAKFNWDDHKYSKTEVLGATQEEWTYLLDSSRYGSLYTVLNSLIGMPALNMPHDHSLFKDYGLDLGRNTRLLIEGGIDFINGCGGLDLSIVIDASEDEEEYITELLIKLKEAEDILKDRLKRLNGKRLKGKKR